MQEAFCRLLRADAAPGEEEERRRYVFRIAGNLMVDRWRRAEREASWFERLRGERSAQAEADGEEGIARQFAALKPRDRALLWLAYVEEHNHREIASALGLTRGSVKVLLSRARARLKKLLVTRGVTARA